MRTLRILALLAGSSVAMFGATCANAAYSVYTAGGFTCTLGPGDIVTFSNFTYTAGLGVASAADINVIVTNGTTLGFTFDAVPDWSLTGGGSASAFFDYDVVVANPFVLDFFRIEMIANAVNGSATSTKTLSAGAADSISANLSNGSGGAFNQAPISPPSAGFHVQDTVTLVSNDNLVTQDNIGNLFGLQGRQDVPEPTSMVLLGAGLLGLGLMRRKVS